MFIEKEKAMDRVTTVSHLESESREVQVQNGMAELAQRICRLFREKSGLPLRVKRDAWFAEGYDGIAYYIYTGSVLNRTSYLCLHKEINGTKYIGSVINNDDLIFYAGVELDKFAEEYGFIAELHVTHHVTW